MTLPSGRTGQQRREHGTLQRPTGPSDGPRSHLKQHTAGVGAQSLRLQKPAADGPSSTGQGQGSPRGRAGGLPGAGRARAHSCNHSPSNLVWRHTTPRETQGAGRWGSTLSGWGVQPPRGWPWCMPPPSSASTPHRAPGGHHAPGGHSQPGCCLVHLAVPPGLSPVWIFLSLEGKK